MAFPVGLACQLSLTPAAQAPSSWLDLTPYVQSFHVRRGKQRLIDRFEAGTMDIVLKNLDRRFDPLNQASPYYPNLRPLNQIRLGFVIGGVTYWAYTGFVERWPQIWKGPTWAETDLTCVDGFEMLSNHKLTSRYASLTTALGTNKDLTYTAVQIGYVGNATTIAYVVAGLNTALSVSVTGTAITVNVATDGSGNPTSTANAVLAAVAASVPADALVTVGLAPGSDGTGIVSALVTTALSGGTFTQELSGARVNDVLNFIGWVAGSTVSAGTKQVQAQAIAASDTGVALDHLQAVELTEQGALFIARDGSLIYLDADTLVSTPYSSSLATFVDAGNRGTGLYGYQTLQGDYDKDLVYNDVRSTRLNGSLQETMDSTSDMDYFTRSLELAPLSINDAESLTLAQAYLARYKQPYFRFEPMQMLPGSDTNFWKTLATLDLMDTVTVKRTPPGGGFPGIAVNGRVIAVEITGSNQLANTRWSLQIDPTSGASGFILDDPVFGLLDKNYLGY